MGGSACLLANAFGAPQPAQSLLAVASGGGDAKQMRLAARFNIEQGTARSTTDTK
jgi:hypothetical protein